MTKLQYLIEQAYKTERRGSDYAIYVDNLKDKLSENSTIYRYLKEAVEQQHAILAILLRLTQLNTEEKKHICDRAKKTFIAVNTIACKPGLLLDKFKKLLAQTDKKTPINFDTLTEMSKTISRGILSITAVQAVDFVSGKKFYEMVDKYSKAMQNLVTELKYINDGGFKANRELILASFRKFEQTTVDAYHKAENVIHQEYPDGLQY